MAMKLTEAEPTPAAPPAAKLPDDFKPNEPTALSGVDAEGKPDQSLSDNQLERAATEALHSLRPQPTAVEIQNVLDRLAEVDEKGHPKVKVKTAKEAADKAIAMLSEVRKP